MWIAVALIAVVAAGVGAWLIARRGAGASASGEPVLREQLQKAEGQLADVRAQLTNEQQLRVEAQTRLEQASKGMEEQRQLLDEARERFKEAFDALSHKALSENSAEFLKLAQGSLEKVLADAQGDLGQRELAIKNLVKPLDEHLAAYQKEVKELESKRAMGQGELGAQVSALLDAQRELSQHADRLANALRVPQVRGRWGELTLERVIELAGLSEHCDFTEQLSVGTEEGKLRPDVVVHLPGGQQVVIDAKTPLDAYMAALEVSEDQQEPFLAAHAQHLRGHMLRLASKGYWAQFAKTPEFVIMFVPGESFFGAALRQDRTLLEDGVANRVVLATPVTLIALLRAIAYGWRQEQFTKSAQVVADLGKEVYRRFVVYLEHVERVRKGLKQSVEAFNDMAGSLETRVLPSLRRFPELGATGEGELPKVEAIDIVPKSIAAREKLPSEVNSQ